MTERNEYDPKKDLTKILAIMNEYLESDAPGADELEAALKLGKDATITILGLGEKEKQQLDFGIQVYKAAHNITAKIEIIVGGLDLVMEDDKRAIAINFVEANRENPIINLILTRVEKGHRLEKPFVIATGWSEQECDLITDAMDTYLEHVAAGFKVVFKT